MGAHGGPEGLGKMGSRVPHHSQQFSSPPAHAGSWVVWLAIIHERGMAQDM